MRIVFYGAGEFGLPTLTALRERHEVVLVVTQPDRPAGRKRKLAPTPVGRFAADRNLPTLKPEKVNADDVVERIAAAEPDAQVVIAFGQKMGESVIGLPALGRRATMNLHASLLPKYRGAAPINWAIIRGETKTGNTVMNLVDRMDAGDILAQRETPIDPLETAGELHDRLAEMGVSLVRQTLDDAEAGRLDPQPQDESQMSIAPKLSRADRDVNFATSADYVRRVVHGLTPWPGVTVSWSAPGGVGPNPLKLCRVRPRDRPPAEAEAGTMLEDGVIACGEGAVELLEVQAPGKRVMNWSDFRRGHDVPTGTKFEGA